MKKFVAVVITLCCILSFSGCVLEFPVDTNQTVNPTQSSPINTDQIILDNDKLTATFQGVSEMESLGVFYVHLKILNKMDEEVIVTLESADVDGETVPLVTTGVPLQIRPGNSGATGFIFTMSPLSIDTVADAERVTFKVVLRNADSFDVVFESDLIDIYPNK